MIQAGATLRHNHTAPRSIVSWSSRLESCAGSCSDGSFCFHVWPVGPPGAGGCTITDGRRRQLNGSPFGRGPKQQTHLNTSPKLLKPLHRDCSLLTSVDKPRLHRRLYAGQADGWDEGPCACALGGSAVTCSDLAARARQDRILPPTSCTSCTSPSSCRNVLKHRRLKGWAHSMTEKHYQLVTVGCSSPSGQIAVPTDSGP